MSYSCSDFTDDVLNCLVTTGALRAGAIPAESPGEQSDLAVAAIIGMSRAALACRFAAELLAGVESIGAIAEQYGLPALSALFYLQAAILDGRFVEIDARERGAIEVIQSLPSAGEWMKYVRVVERDNSSTSAS